MKVVKLDRRFIAFKHGFTKAVHFNSAYNNEYENAWKILKKIFPDITGKHGSWRKTAVNENIYVHRAKPRWVDKETGKRTHAPYLMSNSGKYQEPIYICFRNEKDLVKYLLHF